MYKQQYKLLRYLTLEIITPATPNPTDYQIKESDRLQSEILTHLQNVLTQFWREPHISRIKEQYGSMRLAQIIESLPNMIDDLIFHQRFMEEIHQIEQLNLMLKSQQPPIPPRPPPQPPQLPELHESLPVPQHPSCCNRCFNNIMLLQRLQLQPEVPQQQQPPQ